MFNLFRPRKREYKLDADPKTFSVLKNKSYGSDNRSVFFEGEKIPGADPGTFETLGEYYAKDKHHGYRGGQPIPTSRGQGFKLIDENYYSTDGTDVFYDTFALHVCSVSQFKIMFNGNVPFSWATDGCYYFYMQYRIPSDDYAHMVIYRKGGGLAKDSKYVYFMDHKVNCDFDGKRTIDTVDAASFEVTGMLECRDRWGCINPYHGREECGGR